MKKLISLVLMLIITLSLAACTNPKGNADTETDSQTTKNAPQSLVIAAQYTSNTAEPMLNSSYVSNLIYEAALCDGSSAVLIEADGSPYTVDAFTFSVKENVSKSKKQAMARQAVNKVIQIANTSYPKTAEVNTLKALNESARNIDRNAEVKTVIYLGSALQTCGELPFSRQNLLEADPDAVIEQLKEMKAIPEFPEGTTVIFAGVGDVALPQKELSYENVSALKEIWKRVCEEGGANVKFITATPTSNFDPSAYPEVSIVKVKEKYVKGKKLSLDDEKAFEFDAETIPFEPDSYKLADPDGTKELLLPLVNQLKESGHKILVCGTTATVGKNEDCILFSEKRSNSLAELMIGMGLDKDQIKIMGLGYDNKYHVPDLSSDGSLNEKEAQKNRLVIIMSQDSEEAISLLGGM